MQKCVPRKLPPLGGNRGFGLSRTVLWKRVSRRSEGEASPVPGFSQVSVVLSPAPPSLPRLGGCRPLPARWPSHCFPDR